MSHSSAGRPFNSLKAILSAVDHERLAAVGTLILANTVPSFNELKSLYDNKPAGILPELSCPILPIPGTSAGNLSERMDFLQSHRLRICWIAQVFEHCEVWLSPRAPKIRIAEKTEAALALETIGANGYK